LAQTPPFRAEHVGSLLRPEKLLKARAAAEGDQYKTVSGSLALNELRDIENEAIREAVQLQEDAGLEVITDGEFRRRSWYQDFLLGLSGTSITFVSADKTVSAVLPFQDDTTVEKLPGHLVQVDGRLRRTKGLFTDAFQFLKSVTKKTPKVTLPAPTMLHFWGGRGAVSEIAYPDMDQFWDDVVGIWTAEIKDLYDLGCRYVQIDDVTLPLICDARSQAAMQRRGDDPEATVVKYAQTISKIADSAPDDMTIGMHMCRGNNRGKWMGSGDYEYISETVFNHVNVDAFFMEYDTSRAGDFQPLRHLPKGKFAVLGLISTKTPKLEARDEIKRRVDEASKFASLDQLCLSPQCGFASNFMGNPVTIEDEKRKLSLVVEMAQDIWH
jgi:5-methyltetrahydropteroyltriglutamate--homocysteine methyltransferase